MKIEHINALNHSTFKNESHASNISARRREVSLEAVCCTRKTWMFEAKKDFKMVQNKLGKRLFVRCTFGGLPQ